jgi:two-component system phosphate regulon sensor histidine kinase PhoR
MDDGFTKVEGDPLFLRQLILNITENGLKYTPAGGEVELKVKGDRDQGVVRIFVSDTGVGIAPKDRKRVFDRFYRVDKARSRDTGGTGLGLSICQSDCGEEQGGERKHFYGDPPHTRLKTFNLSLIGF